MRSHRILCRDWMWKKLREYREEEYLMLSGIQHFTFCRRQWALIHIEQQWEENFHTVDGRIMHENAHDGFSCEKRKDTIISRGMPVYSRSMGVSGICDVVEFKRSKDGVYIKQFDDTFEVMPIEYKRGKPKEDISDILQVAAQVMCLEEMLVCTIEKGALFYGQTRRRMEVQVTAELRQQVRDMFVEMHQYYERGYTPRVKKSKACSACSLKDICLPELERARSAKAYIVRSLEEESE